MSEDVRSLCKSRYPGPCSRIYAADMVTVVETFDCTVWCPVLKRPIEEEEEDDADLVNDALSD